MSWTGVDLDGTLAYYSGWQGKGHIGDPVPSMLERVKAWVAQGHDVRIFTARAHRDSYLSQAEYDQVIGEIYAWCELHVGVRLPVTNQKDYGMIELYDDRCVQVIPNTGELVQDMVFKKT